MIIKTIFLNSGATFTFKDVSFIAENIAGHSTFEVEPLVTFPHGTIV